MALVPPPASDHELSPADRPPRDAVGGAGAFAAAGLVMLTQEGPGSRSTLEITLTLVILISAFVLLIWSKLRSNRRADKRLERNQVLKDVSDRIDREVEAGRIPLAPAGWTGRISAPSEQQSKGAGKPKGVGS